MRNKLCIPIVATIFYCVSFASTTLAQTNNCDTIPWNRDRKLTWNDFKAKPNNKTLAAASSNINFLHRWKVENGILVAKVICIFSPCKSWVKDSKSDYLLKHEQGHFDIGEYYRRLYNKQVMEEQYTPQTLSLVVLKAYVDIQIAYLRNQYDEETDHSRNKYKQEEWNKKIVQMLNSMQKYSADEVRLKLPVPTN